MPFAAQSRLDPEPYSLPPMMTSGTPSFWYAIAASKMLTTSVPGRCRVHPPSTREPSSRGGTSRFRSRTLANVPRIITSWCPRRDPYELKSFCSTPCSSR